MTIAADIHLRRLGGARGGPGFRPESDSVGVIDNARLKSSAEALEFRMARFAPKSRLSASQQKLAAEARVALSLLVERGSDAKLTKMQSLLLEAVAEADGSRPALLVRGGRVEPNDSAAGMFAQDLQTHQTELSAAIMSTGRILVGGMLAGTGWMMDKRHVVTNRHVAEKFAVDKAAPATPVRENADVWIDFLGEVDNPETHRFRLKRIVYWGLETTTDENGFNVLDLAILEIEPGEGVPPVMELAGLGSGPQRNDRVYVVGYPSATHYSGLPRKVLADLFGPTLGVKRLSPGEVAVRAGGVPLDNCKCCFVHDATTLGGNSGSPVVAVGDDGRLRAVGLHFGGREVVLAADGSKLGEGANYALAFAKFKDDVTGAIEAALRTKSAPAPSTQTAT
jgi:hypothetical protein